MAEWKMSRRAFLQGSALVLGSVAAGPRLLAAEPESAKPRLRIGLITDAHYADKEMTINRYYRDTPDKLREAIQVFNESPPDFAVQLGDLIDSGGSIEDEIMHLKTADTWLSDLKCERHHVLGNHCVYGLTKEEYLANNPAMDTTHYAFERGGVRFIVVDSCFRSDGEPYGRRNYDWTDANIPDHELRWLESELAKDDQPVIVFAHQRLDEAELVSVRNAAEVRDVLEKSGNVLAVFQGHDHPGGFSEINGIAYCTLIAMVEGPGPENSAYSILSLYDDASMRLEGFRRQPEQAIRADQ